MSPKRLLFLMFVFSVGSAYAQTEPSQVAEVLGRRVQVHQTVAYQLQEYLFKSIPPLPAPSSARQWAEEEAHLRKQILDDVAFHGWPREWVDSPPKFEDMGEVPGGNGYRMRKLRFEIVPGFDSTAILYEPLNVSGKAPAILNVHGHDPLGKAAEYKQKRCINFAKRGIYALSLEWIGFGELNNPENAHEFGADLDLVGSNDLGIFYLAMRRGLDYLAGLPQVDTKRLGVTGLSGGGWQTITLSALDPRVSVMVEVAGFGSLQSNITHPVDTDCDEQDPPDLDRGRDYTFYVAMRAPHPTMLIHNAEDNCCFRADLVKPYTYEPNKAFFKLFGQPDNLAWHENRDPSTHNYYLDNREHAYRFFTEHFNLPIAEHEIPSGAEIKTYDELKVGLPQNNLTLLGLARQFAAQIQRQPIPAEGPARTSWASAERHKLASVIRYKPVKVKNAWRMWNTKNHLLQSLTYRFDFSDGLTAAGTWLKAIATAPDAPVTVVLNDKGREAAGAVVSDRVNRDEQVLALDPIFIGESMPLVPDSTPYALLVSTTGGRALGLEVEQLLAVTKWLEQQSGHGKVRLETTGIRSEVIGLAAAALDPDVFSEVVSNDAMKSLGYLLDAPVPFRSAPDLFCLDLYKDFDLDRLAAMAGSAKWEPHYLSKPSTGPSLTN
ncbi:MAG TPA: acetylxylan esterase [Terriglobia bacterium]|nr:acetylxylan esterase [Terriglobia bacterium]